MRVDEVIAAYLQAREDDDRVRASRLLESLEGEQYANEADWERIRAFCAAEGFDARLEIITKTLLKKCEVKNAAPFMVLSALLVKSGRVSEARPLLTQYKKLSSGRDHGQWDLVNMLFAIEVYDECLQVIHNVLAQSPGEVPFLIMEARSLWAKGDGREARKKLSALMDRLGSESGNWVWFTVVAKEFNEPQLAEQGVHRLMKLLEQGQAKLSQSVIYAMEQAGQQPALKKLIAAADPALYDGLPAYLELFDAAVRYGVHQASVRFGQAILALEPAHALRTRIERLALGPEFLMS